MKKIILNLLLSVLVLAAILGGLVFWLAASNSELTQLNKSRKAVFSQVRPAFLKFHTENGRFPQALNELVPTYLSSIPRELQADGFPDIKSGRINYKGDKDKAVFSFRSIHGPDGNATYDLVKDEYWYEQ